MSHEEDTVAHLKNIARDIQAMRSMLTEVIRYMKEAESEIPERIRRFIMYFHDVHDIQNLYHEFGITPPDYILREIERCSDRFKHILEDLYAEMGAFEKVRQEMSKRAGNRYDYSRQLSVHRRTEDETRNDTDTPSQSEGGTDESSD